MANSTKTADVTRTSARGRPLKPAQQCDPETRHHENSVAMRAEATSAVSVANENSLAQIETLLKRVEERAEKADERVESRRCSLETSSSHESLGFEEALQMLEGDSQRWIRKGGHVEASGNMWDVASTYEFLMDRLEWKAMAEVSGVHTNKQRVKNGGQ
ncbi:hypothetical protein HIM_10822 [Hirsutella minnesotensis 3608]|uniref:Uncharacterized protein n=1 Tax=Hirsutella minnesotensis 3608 TaxID=1043627 RepID=A0A0F7ZRK7_9HYPO|nr:hypothetical protein HIM_10822 [Hirsutella minnesotensis 3608]